MQIKAVIFDFDGLILDTEEPEFQSWQEIYQQHGTNLTLETWLPFIGAGTDTVPFDIYEHLELQSGTPVDREEIRRIRRSRYMEFLGNRSLLPGVETWIADAQRLGIHLAVASSSYRDWVVGHLTERQLLAHFAYVTCADEVQATKPSPDLYLLTLKKLGIAAEEAIALEDSPKGVAAAKAAGIFCIAVPNPLTRHLPFKQADIRLTSLADYSLEALIADGDKSRDQSVSIQSSGDSDLADL
jgi:HAD superfamily hydrolase (TIGR01509 family)